MKHINPHAFTQEENLFYKNELKINTKTYPIIGIFCENLKMFEVGF